MKPNNNTRGALQVLQQQGYVLRMRLRELFQVSRAATAGMLMHHAGQSPKPMHSPG